ncbi:MAG: hypothetical protein KGH53_03070 [Candidatus Micrarchaeota archaeon]|nr:hypothetical protein [Candidatus Micrarchaeota archaeon]
MVFKLLTAKAPFLANSASISGTDPFRDFAFNHGLDFHMTKCVDGIINVLDKINCNNETISNFFVSHSNVTMSINSTLKSVLAPGWAITNDVAIYVNNAMVENMTVIANGTKHLIQMGFLNITAFNFFNDSANNLPAQGAIDAWQHSVSFNCEIFSGSALVGMALLLSELDGGGAGKLIEKVSKGGRALRAALRI